jgi:hypothetical protein
MCKGLVPIPRTPKKKKTGQVWCTPVIPALGRLRQEDCEFEASLDCMARPVSKKQQKKCIENKITTK